MRLAFCRTFCATIISAIFLAGCFVTPTPPQVEPNPHQQLYEAFSKYYCKNLKWPKKVEDTIPYAEEAGIVVRYERYTGAKVTSERAILVTVSGLQREVKGAAKSVSFVAPPICGGASITAGSIWMAGGRIHVKIPAAFSQLGAQEISERWGKGPYPDVAWSNPKTQELLAVRFGEAPLKSGGYEEMQEAMEAAYAASAPGIVWKSRAIRTVAKRSWIELAFESKSKNGPLTNVNFTTDFDGKILTFSWIGPVADKEILTRSRSMLDHVEIIKR